MIRGSLLGIRWRSRSTSCHGFPRRTISPARLAARTDHECTWCFRGHTTGATAFNKLMTNKFPDSAVIVEFATYTKKIGVRAVVEWSPPAAHHEADELANGVCTAVDPANRLDVYHHTLAWDLLPEALDDGHIRGSHAGWETEEKKTRREIWSRRPVVSIGTRARAGHCRILCHRRLGIILLLSIPSLSSFARAGTVGFVD